MTIAYWPPLHESIARTRSLLFRPFDLGRWFTMGFIVWLVHLGQSLGSAAGSDSDVQTHVRVGDWGAAADSLAEHMVDVLPTDALALAGILAVTSIMLVVMLALLWVSCRARFVWLENLTVGDHTVGRYWNQHARLADSFFIWKIAYFLLVLLVVMPLVFFGGVFGYLGIAGFDGPGSVLGWLLLGMAVFMVSVVLIYVDFFAESFVTVIMHRRRIGVVAAWREFRALFEDHAGAFVLVGLMKLALHLAAAVVLTMAGLLTCCVGFFLMAIPYLGAVFKLPVLTALRYYDLCWLGQLAPDLALPALPTPPDLRPAEPTPDNDPTP